MSATAHADSALPAADARAHGTPSPDAGGSPVPARGGYAARAAARRAAPPAARRATPAEIAGSTLRKLGWLWAAQWRARFWSEARFARYQDRQLRRLVRRAHAAVPLYRELWDRAGVDVAAFRGRADLAALPIVEKDDVRDHWPEGVVAAGTDLARCRIQQTSGSSGRCMEIALSLRCDDARNIFTQRVYGWQGFRWYNKTAYLFPYRLPFENNLGIYRNVFLDANEPADRILDRIEAERPVVLAATPSDILDLLEGCAPDRDLRRLGLRALSLHSEPIAPDERAHFEQRFGCVVRTNYYCNEVWTIAAECEHGAMHEFMDNVILELVDDAGRPVPDGEPGHVIVTSLGNSVQPFVRYRLGDVAVRRRERGCACGRGLPVLERLEGRDDDTFLHPDGRRIHPSKITVAVKSPCFAHPGLQVFRDYQIVQEAPDRVRVRLVPGRDREPFEACARDGVANLERLLAPGVRVELEVAERLEPGAGGKRKIFERRWAPRPAGE